QADDAAGERDVVDDDEEIGRRIELVEADRLRDGLPGAVHEGEGLEEQRALAAQFGLDEETLEAIARRSRGRGIGVPTGKPVDDLEPDVVSGPVVLGSGVAQSGDQLQPFFSFGAAASPSSGSSLRSVMTSGWTAAPSTAAASPSTTSSATTSMRAT